MNAATGLGEKPKGCSCPRGIWGECGYCREFDAILSGLGVGAKAMQVKVLARGRNKNRRGGVA